MKLDLSTYLSHQRDLDKAIMDNHGETRESTREKRILALIIEISELANETRCFKYWSYKGASPKEMLLEEFSDTLHFTLSLGLDLNRHTIEFETEAPESLTQCFIEWTKVASELKTDFDDETYDRCLKYLGATAHSLGFTPEEIEDAYFQKNKKNHQRQNEAY